LRRPDNISTWEATTSVFQCRWRWCKISPMTAYAYLRKSSVRDPEREVSHEVQEAAVRALAARHGDGDDLVILSDWDKSGRLGADRRPGYRALLESIESGRATAIYSYSLSRLARSVAELSRLVADCDRRGIAVRLDADSIDTSTASGRLTANVLGSVAEFEADVASERVRAAIATKAAKGERVGTVPFYGDRPGEDVEAVLAAFREAGSFSGAARLLNDRKVPTARIRPGPDGKPRGWWPSSVSVIVKRLDPTALVGRSTRGARAGGSAFALARLLRCPTCGTMLTGTRDRDGSRVRYSCRLGSVTPHERVSVSEHLILPPIREEVARLATPARVQALAGDEAARAGLEAERLRVLDMYQSGDIGRDEKEGRLAGIVERAERLEARQVVMAIPDVDWSWEPRALNGVLRALFERIELDRATFKPSPEGFVWTVPEWRA
jgi:DNA invertase Pin-like site-specific DNA recombinase